MSLKSNLQKLIRERGYLSMNQVEEYCKQHNYRLSNAERRLRQSESPMIEAVREKGYIIGYRPRKVINFTRLPDLEPLWPKNTEEMSARVAAINAMESRKLAPKKEIQGLFPN